MQFEKHPMENLKDLKTLRIIEQHYNLKPVYTNFQRATRNGSPTQKRLNPQVEQMYHLIVTKVKQLFATLPDKADRVIVELDLKAMPTDSVGMYSILTSTFYFSIECDVRNNYRIEYLFHNCKFQKELMELISRFSIASYSNENVSLADYPSYFNRVLQVQPEKFISLL